ncbi:hypothetical protein [Actinomadura geliboluensis]|uniref:hypothetical protein n=1 Tax=Actinomadura geliboluensis TaxID=882440 RepID=UPI0036A902CD
MFLADQLPPPGGSDLGTSWFFYVGPAVIFLAVVFWVVVTLTASRKPPRSRRTMGGLPNRGPVQGGVIQGSPSQRTRRDPAPSVTHREVMDHIEQARAEEEAVQRPEPPRKARRRKRRHLFGGR